MALSKLTYQCCSVNKKCFFQAQNILLIYSLWLLRTALLQPRKQMASQPIDHQVQNTESLKTSQPKGRINNSNKMAPLSKMQDIPISLRRKFERTIICVMMDVIQHVKGITSKFTQQGFKDEEEILLAKCIIT